MSERHPFNHTRLDLAMRRRGLDAWDIANALGCKVPLVHRWLRGEREPSTTAIEVIAEVVNFPPAFFFGPTLDEPTGTSLCL